MSSTTSKPARHRRSRVMLVSHDGDEMAATQVAPLLSSAPIRARSMFEAIGAAAASRAAEPIAAVMLPEPFLREPHERAVEALRKIDPSVRVVVFTTAQPSGQLPASGVDAWLAVPVRADDLRRALDDDGLMNSDAGPAVVIPDAPASAEPDARDHAAIIELFDPEDASMAAAPAAPESTEVHTTGIAAPVPSTAALPAPALVEPPRARGGQPAPPPGEIIGDTDLIDAVLHHREGVAPLALRLIAHHAGWEQVRLHPASAGIADGTPIRLGHQHFGFLSAGGAAPEALRPWADWLARWLALEDEHRRFRHEAHLDELTGAWNRRFFEAFLSETLADARPDRRPVTVMVFDIDNFKVYNDQFGHAAGDEILREIVRLLKSIVRQGDIVCRIGGDEFVVVFADREAPRTPGSKHPETAESITRRFQQAVCSMRFPKLGGEAPGTLSVSAGLATYPWDGQDAPSLLRHADERALESKRRGKNTVTLGRDVGE